MAWKERPYPGIVWERKLPKSFQQQAYNQDNISIFLLKGKDMCFPYIKVREHYFIKNSVISLTYQDLKLGLKKILLFLIGKK